MPAQRPTLCTQHTLYYPLKHHRAAGKTSHPGQAHRSARKRVLQTQRAAAEAAEAQRLGITVAELQKRKFDAVKHLFRDANKTSVKATTLPDAYIRGWRDEARCPHCDRINEYCTSGINTCKRCAGQFIGKQ